VTRAGSAPSWLPAELREHYERLASALDLAPDVVPAAVRDAVEEHEREATSARSSCTRGRT
jgi:hypothetical protein